MRKLWYVAQALFIGGMTYGMWQRHPEMKAGELAITVFMWIALCAFLTACITQSWDWAVRRLRGLRRHDSDAASDSLSLTGPRSSTPKAAEHLNRVRIGK